MDFRDLVQVFYRKSKDYLGVRTLLNGSITKDCEISISINIDGALCGITSL